MLEVVANLTNAGASSRPADIMSVSVMQQSIGAIKQLSTVMRDLDPATFVSTLDMAKVVDNMELSVTDLPEEVRFDVTLNSYTQVTFYANDIRTRNRYQVLVPENWYQNLVRVSCHLVLVFSGTRFWYQIEHVLFNARI